MKAGDGRLGMGDRIVLTFSAIAAAAAIGYLGWRMTHRSKINALRTIPAELRSRVLPEESRANGKTTLVEFGDYECPPCRTTYQEVERILARAAGRLEFRFRNYPLKAIHPSAYHLALIAEVARSRGLHRVAHRLLYTKTESQALDSLKTIGIDSRHLSNVETLQAKNSVDHDLEDAIKLSLRGTPSFLLCRPDGRTELVSLAAVASEFAPNGQLRRESR